MPNGKYEAQCYTCDFFQGASRPSCRLHDFTLPRVGPEVLCGDWRLAKRHEGDWHFDYAPRFIASEELRALKPGVLYQSLRKFAALGTFDELRNMWLEVWAHPTDELGWAIYLRQHEPEYFPHSGNSFILHLDDGSMRFRVEDQVRHRYMGGHRADDGRWIPRWEDKVTRIVFCPENPTAIGDWLQRYFDVEALLEYYREKPGWAIRDMDDELQVALFVELIKREEEYALHPDLGYYERFERGR